MEISRNIKSTGPGWERIIAPLLAFCEANDVELLQIKEKFGGLRFYYRTGGRYLGGSEPLDNLIRAAEIEAEQTCEWCGAPGQLRGYDQGFGWIKTLCDTHKDEWLKGNRWWINEDGTHA